MATVKAATREVRGSALLGHGNRWLSTAKMLLLSLLYSFNSLVCAFCSEASRKITSGKTFFFSFLPLPLKELQRRCGMIRHPILRYHLLQSTFLFCSAQPVYLIPSHSLSLCSFLTTLSWQYPHVRADMQVPLCVIKGRKEFVSRCRGVLQKVREGGRKKEKRRKKTPKNYTGYILPSSVLFSCFIFSPQIYFFLLASLFFNFTFECLLHFLLRCYNCVQINKGSH